jgi:hypothetical protein
MKKLLVLYPVLFMCLAGGGFLSAQTELLVPATEADGVTLRTNALFDIVADTNAAGEQLHDIYRLERGKYYFYNQSPVFKNPITLVADPPGTTDETKPPKIIVTADDEGSVPYAHCIETFADLTVKNIAFSTTSTDGGYSWANAILLHTDGLRIVLDGCHFTLTGWGILEAAVDNTVFVVTNSHIRNATVYDYGDSWCPFFFEIDVGSVDSLIVANNTWFNMQGSVLNIEQQNFVRYFLFDHNTLVNVIRGFTPLVSHLESVISNNIFYNVEPYSVLATQAAAGEDGMNLSVINADTLAGNEPGSTTVAPMTESERICVVKNNAYFFSQGVQDYWTTHDSVVATAWMNSVTQAMFDDDVGYPSFIAENNVNIDPGFTEFGGTDSMVVKMNEHRSGGGFGFWGWYHPDTVGYPTALSWAILQWPLPEDFSYSADITGSDGFHVGSLQYYPSELAAYDIPLAIDGDKGGSVPIDFLLAQNYPNPFNPATTIDYQLHAMSDVSLTVYNLLGQEIKTLVNASQVAAGPYSVVWDGTDSSSMKVSNGIYFYRLKTSTGSLTRKMVLLK